MGIVAGGAVGLGECFVGELLRFGGFMAEGAERFFGSGKLVSVVGFGACVFVAG